MIQKFNSRTNKKRKFLVENATKMSKEGREFGFSTYLDKVTFFL